jgi:hypothetical protein
MGIFFENVMSEGKKRKKKTPIHVFKKYSSMSMSEETTYRPCRNIFEEKSSYQNGNIFPSELL